MSTRFVGCSLAALLPADARQVLPQRAFMKQLGEGMTPLVILPYRSAYYSVPYADRGRHDFVSHPLSFTVCGLTRVSPSQNKNIIILIITFVTTVQLVGHARCQSVSSLRLWPAGKLWWRHEPPKPWLTGAADAANGAAHAARAGAAAAAKRAGAAAAARAVAAARAAAANQGGQSLN